MTNNHPDNKSSSPIPSGLLVFVLLLIPLYFQIAWINAFNSAAGHDARLEQFYSSLPSFLADAHLTATLGLVCSVVVMIVSMRSLSVKNMGWRIFHVAALLISGVLLLLNLFQFM